MKFKDLLLCLDVLHTLKKYDEDIDNFDISFDKEDGTLKFEVKVNE